MYMCVLSFAGKKQQVALYRDGGFVRNITNDEVYDYNSPFFYR